MLWVCVIWNFVYSAFFLFLKAVELCSVHSLFQCLSRSILNHSALQHTSIIDYCFQRPIKQPFLHDRNRVHRLSRKLAFSCMDVVLLRKWEWMGTDSGGLWQWLALSLTLHHRGKPDSAHHLATAVSWLLRENCILKEAENILRFLFLLSTPNTKDVMETPQTKAGHVYSYYPELVPPCQGHEKACKAIVCTCEKY